MRLLHTMRQHLLLAVLVLGMQCVLLMAMAWAVDVFEKGEPSATSWYTKSARSVLLDFTTPAHLLLLCLVEAPLLIAALAYLKRLRRAARAKRRAARAEVKTAYFDAMRRSLPRASSAPSPPGLAPPEGRPGPAVDGPGDSGVVGRPGPLSGS